MADLFCMVLSLVLFRMYQIDEDDLLFGLKPIKQ